ncbi:sulfatase-like hydrolase/transferase [Acinetobacter rudis]|uniref:Sulfatase-like hydrolase/transferase n=1 Tax=Acinetobacter rudis TaxID=632955 RepID=A0AAW8J936_9GAMM|nr:sulfatase-like hydrolase/transferase [Acinetobacter rudis]MDQ8936582.1 sulfatase-like hydrolase/transferase [Acinetobacter rudis]MDQ8954182.1 sulfatase-like hydrolase/transferase [Acinetobacter rudis]MDQ9018843.1 sulfatase-like hydrolase/transferase [Acinetobacter rudis]
MKNPTVASVLHILIISVLMAIGEYVFSTNDSLQLSFSSYVTTYLLVFIVLLVARFSKYKTIAVVLSSLIVLGTGINVVFNQYFGRYLMPYDIAMFFTEIEDTSKGLISGIAIFIKPLLWYLALYIYSLYIIFKMPIRLNNKVSIVNTVLSLLFIIAFFIPVFNHKKFEVSLHYSVVRNSIGVYTHYLGGLVKKNNAQGKEYPAYTLSKNNSAVNVIFIMGESANFEHMSLYGYPRDTTPYLKSLAEQHPDQFKYFHGVSRGFSTRIGVPLTLNVIQEPDNSKQLLSLKTNLFHLAKQNQYATYYLSNQKSGVLASLVNATDVDEFHDVNSKIIPQDTLTDFRLIKFLENMSTQHDFSKPFFVVLHQRNNHFAYVDNYPASYDIYKTGQSEKEKLVDTYDNSMHFQDDFIKSLIQTTEKITNKPTIIVYTSDHSELFGYDNLWGHGAPILQTAGVPIFLYALNGAEKLLQDPALSNECLLGNYELGKFVASSIGWNIHNPNEVKDYFVNISLPYDDAHGYKKFDHDIAQKAFCKK